MRNKRSLPRMASMALAAAAITQATAADIAAASGRTVSPTRARAMGQFLNQNPRANFFTTGAGDISRVYGKAFSHGSTTAESAERFIDQHASIWGVSAQELVAEGPFDDKRHTLPLGYDADTGHYKFTAHYYTQYKQGVPVYNSKLVLLVRNEDDSPLVLATAALHDLSAFTPSPTLARQAADRGAITDTAAKQFGGVAQIWSTDRVIYAGDEANPHAPVLADNTIIDVDGYKKFRLITDAATGEVLFEESLIHTIDVSGNVSGNVSDGPAADFCSVEVAKPLPYLNVAVQGGGASITDVNGDFTIANAGSSDVTVNADLDGQWFDVFNFLGSETSESLTGAPGTAFDILFNSLNNSEQTRAQVNAYLESNVIRDYVLDVHPAYPLVAGNNDFPVTVNRTDGFCPGNAWYDPVEDSINFCLSSGSSPNTAWTSVVYHEYGHHLVSAGGSGQGQYGEGMGDVMSLIILDNPELGIGFFGSCGGSLRSADNTFEYPCTAGSHACAPLLSGAVWDTRNALIVTEPDDYQDILMYLAVNSIPMHTGTEINDSITIDWLTLDDDDADIGNGTPHYFEIDAGFGAKGMPAPELSLVGIQPVDAPEIVDPSGGTMITAEFSDVAATLDPNTPTLHVDTGAGYVALPMTAIGDGQYQASFPGANCGSGVSYFFSAMTTSGLTQTLPLDAPASALQATAAFDAPAIVFQDNAQTDMGWTVSGGPGDSGSGRWERAVPGGDGSRGDAPTDFDGSGFCFVTGNGGPNSNTDVDGGTTTLTSPIMDATGFSIISYARWYDNSAGAAPGADIFTVEISDNGGASWTNLETVGPSDSESSGGWFMKQFNLGQVAGFTANDQFRIRFNASDLGDGSVIEAAVDAISLEVFDCTTCPADLSGDGELNFFDVSAFLTAFNSGDPAADFNNDGDFNFFDVSAFLAAFNAGCP